MYKFVAQKNLGVWSKYRINYIFHSAPFLTSNHNINDFYFLRRKTIIFFLFLEFFGIPTRILMHGVQALGPRLLPWVVEFCQILVQQWPNLAQKPGGLLQKSNGPEQQPTSLMQSPAAAPTDVPAPWAGQCMRVPCTVKIIQAMDSLVPLHCQP